MSRGRRGGGSVFASHFSCRPELIDVTEQLAEPAGKTDVKTDEESNEQAEEARRRLLASDEWRLRRGRGGR